MNDVLLTISGVIDPQIEEQTSRGERPLADYMAMARTFKADLLDYTAARTSSGRIGRLLARAAGPNLALAWACFQRRKRYRAIFTDGEQVGLPLAALLKLFSNGRRPHHLMIGHLLSVRKKMILLDLLGLADHVDTFFVYATWQKAFIEARWDVPAERVVFTPFMVDANFFSPDQPGGAESLELDIGEKPLICSVGLEFRDYPTLIEAVRGLDVHVVIAAASPWSRRKDTTADQEIPENVTVRKFTQFELRQLYAMSRFVVMPLYDVNFQAGVTTLLEAMAMEKAVICTRTPGQADVVVDGETGIYVPPTDPDSLREAIQSLLQNPDEADRLGRNGRQRILDQRRDPVCNLL